MKKAAVTGVLLWLALSHILSARPKIDSLKLLLINAKPDTNKVKIMNQFSFALNYSYVNPN